MIRPIFHQHSVITDVFVRLSRGASCLVRRGVWLKEIDEFNTSKVCHTCWYVDRKECVMDKYDHSRRPEVFPNRESISVREHKCTYSKVVGCKFNCGTIMNRDTNAAKNMTRLAACAFEGTESPNIFQRLNKQLNL